MKITSVLAVVTSVRPPFCYTLQMHMLIIPHRYLLAKLWYDAQNQPLVAVAAPWAKDANGKDVRTYFTTNGKKLTQHVAHKAQGVAYPVVADPFWIPAWAVAQIIRCGFGGYLGYISSGGWDWWWRALAVVGGCLIGVR